MRQKLDFKVQRFFDKIKFKILGRYLHLNVHGNNLKVLIFFLNYYHYNHKNGFDS